MDTARLNHEWRRQQLAAGAIAAAAVVAIALIFHRPWIIAIAAILVLAPPIRRALGRALGRLTRGRAEELAHVAHQREWRKGHQLASPVVLFGGRAAVLSFDKGRFYVTEASTAAELTAFDPRSVREVNYETTRVAAPRDGGGRRSMEGARLVIYLDDLKRPLVMLEFGRHMVEAREWQARLRAAKEGTQQVFDRGGVPVVREVKVRCRYCGTLVDQGIEKCPACAAPL